MPCEDCLSRREFLAKGGLAVAGAAALVTACGDGQFGPTAVTSSVGGNGVSVKVASLPGLATVGQLVRIPPDSAEIVAKRTGATTFVAFSMICTHQGCETAISGSGLVCPCHGSRYDSDGHVTRQPDGGGSATNLPTYTTKYDAATDMLTIT
jgi:Rieske Fe-S protein